MKKLTAGIFATILGLTAIDAYAAQVASTNYVQGAINSLATVAKTGAYDDLTGKPTIPSLDGYAKESWVEGKGYATTTEVNNLHEAQAQVIGVNQVAIKGLQDADTAFAQEQDAQDTEIAKKANSADVYTKTLADTTFVKVSDVVDTYVAN